MPETAIPSSCSSESNSPDLQFLLSAFLIKAERESAFGEETDFSSARMILPFAK